MSAVSHDCKTRSETLHGPIQSTEILPSPNDQEHSENKALDIPNLMETLKGQSQAPQFFGESESRVLSSTCEDKPLATEHNFAKFSLFFIRSDYPIRSGLIWLIRSKYFDRTILVAIILNCIALMLDSKRPNFEETGLGKGLMPFEYLFLGIFTAEMIIKIVAMGFMLSPHTYMRDGWNVLDMAVVLLGWFAFFPFFGNYTAIRVVRVFRPLRTITGIEGMRVLVVTLIRSLPLLLDVMILCTFAFFIFGILGVQLFSGQLQYRCGYPTNVTMGALESIKYTVPPSEEGQICSGRMSDEITWSIEEGVIVPNGGTDGFGRACPSASTEYPYGLFCTKHENPNFGITSFDNILWAWLTIFQCISLEGWTDIMYGIQDASTPWVWVYFTVLIVFGSFFAVNLALAVLYLHFTNPGGPGDLAVENETDSVSEEATERSMSGESLGQQFDRLKKSKLETFCYTVQKHPYFEGLTMTFIIINTVIMASESHGMAAWRKNISESINLGFALYFALEMLVKVVGLRPKGYVKDKMNVFDGLVVIASLVEIAVMFTPNADGLGGSLSIMRTFRLMRVFKLARSWKELNKIINTIFKSLNSIAYLSLILLLFIFITALLGMQVFGHQFQFCDKVEGSRATCPPGMDALKDCPAHFDCYISCSAEQVSMWITALGSPYNDLAYCEKFPRDSQNEDEGVYLANVGKSTVSRHNFDTMLWSTITVFQILTGEDWNMVMYDGMRSTSSLAAVYFIMMVVLGNYIILNLFLAILLENFAGVSGDDSSSEASSEEDDPVSKIQLPVIPDPKGTYNSLIGAAYSEDEPDKEELQCEKRILSMVPPSRSSSQHVKRLGSQIGTLSNFNTSLEGNSLWIFRKNNPLRLRLAALVGHRDFEYAIIALICLSSITLALDSPTLDPESTMKKILNVLDTIFVVLFALEAMAKICVYGFLLNGKSSYLRNPWNILDFIIVVVGIILFIWKDTEQLTSLRGLRVLRALRPIRVASRNEGMKVVVNALIQSIPPICNVLLVCLLFFLIFGILGVNLLKGKYFYCVDDKGRRLDAAYILSDGSTIDRGWCQQSSHIITSSYYHSKIGVGVPQYEVKHKWVNKAVNFDNIGMAMLALFEMATLEMWLVVMYDGVDAVGVDQQPVLNSNPYICIFFVLFIIVGSFFVLNLFVGVTIDKFNEMQQKQEGRCLLLTSEQEQWLHIQKMVATTQPTQPFKPPENKSRKKVFKIVTSSKFDAIVMGVIITNVLFMALAHANMSQVWKSTMFIAGASFTAFFTVEAAVKIFALGIQDYFKDSWNIFDFCVVAVSIAEMLVDIFSDGHLPIISLIRVFRVARIFRLIPKAKGLRTLFQTLVYSISALANVGSVLFLFFFIFAVMGMTLFGTIRHGEHLNRHANFETFPQALLLLFRMATGEAWNGIMHDCMDPGDCIFLKEDFFPVNGGKLTAGSYFSRGDSLLDEIPSSLLVNQCSPPNIAVVMYFVVFVVVCAFILLNLVIAVILDNFQSSSQNEAMPVSKGHLIQFSEVWSELDPDATNFIPTVRLSTLISELDPPLGVKGTSGGPVAIQNIIMSVDIPNRNNMVHFLETLHALGGRVAGAQIPEEIESKIHEKMYTRLPEDAEFPKYTAAHFYAALYVQAAVRGFLARHKMKDTITDFSESMADKGLFDASVRTEYACKDPDDPPPAVKRRVWSQVRTLLLSMKGSGNKGRVAVVQPQLELAPSFSNSQEQ